MKIYHKIIELLEQGEVIALTKIVKKEGSAPRGAGAKMVVRRDGSIFGTVGGGPLEEGHRRSGESHRRTPE